MGWGLTRTVRIGLVLMTNNQRFRAHSACRDESCTLHKHGTVSSKHCRASCGLAERSRLVWVQPERTGLAASKSYFERRRVCVNRDWPGGLGTATLTRKRQRSHRFGLGRVVSQSECGQGPSREQQSVDMMSTSAPAAILCLALIHMSFSAVWGRHSSGRVPARSDSSISCTQNPVSCDHKAHLHERVLYSYPLVI